MFTITEPQRAGFLWFTPRPDALAHLAGVLRNLGEAITRDPAHPESFRVSAPARLAPEDVVDALRDLQRALKETDENHLYTHPSAIEVVPIPARRSGKGAAYRVQRRNQLDAPTRLRNSLAGQGMAFIAHGRDTQVFLQPPPG